MKKYLHIALMLLCVFVVSSCKDDDDDTEAVEREAYKLEQDIAFQAKVNETGFVRWYSEAGDGYVCAKRGMASKPISIAVSRSTIKVL